MFGLLKAAVNTVALPLDIVVDAARTVASPERRDQERKSRTEKRVERIEENIDSAFDLFD